MLYVISLWLSSYHFCHRVVGLYTSVNLSFSVSQSSHHWQTTPVPVISTEPLRDFTIITSKLMTKHCTYFVLLMTLCRTNNIVVSCVQIRYAKVCRYFTRQS